MFRRLASVAALALVGGLALTGCQAAPPNVAVQIGDYRLTNETVDQIVDQIDDELAKARQAQADPNATPSAPVTGLAKEQVGEVRAAVVQLAVFDEVARRMVADRKLTMPTPNYAETAGQLGLSTGNPYVKLAVDSDAYLSVLRGSVQPVTPTETDLRDAYARVVASGGDQVPGYDELKPQLQAVAELGQGLALKTEMVKAIDKYGVVVNPRYLPLEMPLTAVNGGGGQIVLVSLPLGTTTDGSPAVRDLPSPVGPAVG